MLPLYSEGAKDEEVQELGEIFNDCGKEKQHRLIIGARKLLKPL
jgi:hypothetical protein